MAEITIPVRTESASLQFRDGAGSPLTFSPSGVVKSSISFNAVRPRVVSEVITQEGGSSGIYAVVNNGIAEGGTLTARFILKDVLNLTDPTVYSFFTAWYKNDFTGTGFSAFVPVTATTGTSNQLLLDVRVTLHDAGASGTDHNMTAGCYCKEVGQIEPEGEVYAFSVTLGVVEEWTVS